MIESIVYNIDVTWLELGMLGNFSGIMALCLLFKLFSIKIHYTDKIYVAFGNTIN